MPVYGRLSALVPALLPALDTIRTLAPRVYSVTLRKRVWSGERPGAGQSYSTDLAIVNMATDGTTAPALVHQVSRQDIIASGGRYQAGDWKVGPMTPAFQATIFNFSGGYTDSQLDPPPPFTPIATELFWLMNGPAQPTNAIMAKAGEQATAFHFFVFLRSQGQQSLT